MITTSVELGPLLKRLRKVPREAAVIVQKAITTDAKGFVKDIIGVTPPSMGKADKASQRRGEGKVEADIRKAYGTPADLWRLIRDAAGKDIADNFWAYMKVRQWHRANDIAQRFTGRSLDVFDGGREHQRRRNPRTGRVIGGGQPKNKQIFLAETQERELRNYIRRQQARVGLLASGFVVAAGRLNVKTPKWVQRHGSQVGSINVRSTTGTFQITIANNARHGTANDLPRRIRFVLASDKRKKRLINSIRYDIRAVLKAQRMKVG